MFRFFRHTWKKVTKELYLRTDKKKILEDGSYTIVGNEWEKFLCSCNISHTEKTFLRMIYRLTVGSGRKEIAISLDKMVEYGISRSSALRAVKKFKAAGLIDVKQVMDSYGKHNTYSIIGGAVSVQVREFEKEQI